MKTLRGRGIRESDYQDIQKQLRALFKKLIFDPIIEVLAPHNAQVKAAARNLKNSKSFRNAKHDVVIDAINSGRIQYVDGIFSGDFNALISSALKGLGAKFNKQTATWAIVTQALPVQIADAAAEYNRSARRMHDEVDATLNDIQMNLSYDIQQNPVDADKMIKRLDRDFQEHYGDALGVSDLSEKSKKKLAKSYSDSLRPYIKKFADEQIYDLRQMVKANAESGYRFDSLVERIQNRYDVTESKAEFLARQETSIYVSKARQVRFREVGITDYIWQTAGDTRVRSDHAHLDGQQFQYAKPPVVDLATGRKANPGEDYNCRCVASPVISNVLEPA